VLYTLPIGSHNGTCQHAEQLRSPVVVQRCLIASLRCLQSGRRHKDAIGGSSGAEAPALRRTDAITSSSCSSCMSHTIHGHTIHGHTNHGHKRRKAARQLALPPARGCFFIPFLPKCANGDRVRFGCRCRHARAYSPHKEMDPMRTAIDASPALLRIRCASSTGASSLNDASSSTTPIMLQAPWPHACSADGQLIAAADGGGVHSSLSCGALPTSRSRCRRSVPACTPSAPRTPSYRPPLPCLI